MKITWSMPIRGEPRGSSRGDVVRARSLIDALRAQGHEVVVVEDGAGAGARARVAVYRRLVRRVVPRRIARMLRDVGRVLHARRHSKRLVAAARAQGAQLLIETQVHFADSGRHAARATGLPLILDDCSPWREEAVLGAGLPRLAQWVFARQAAAAARLVAPSVHVRALLVAGGVPEQRVRVVPNGVDVAAHERAARQWGAPRDGRITLVFAGSFQPWHRVELLVSAFAAAAHRNELDLLLLGDGPGRETALAEVERLGLSDRVSAPGAVFASLLPEVLAVCDVGVLPDTNEYGHPMKLLEYAAAGLPAVAPDLPAVREVVEHGVTGILFAPGDVHALATAIDRLAGDTELRTRMGRVARDRCLGISSWSERARSLIDGFGPTEPERAGHAPIAPRRGSPRAPSAVVAAS